MFRWRKLALLALVGINVCTVEGALAGRQRPYPQLRNPGAEQGVKGNPRVARYWNSLTNSFSRNGDSPYVRHSGKRGFQLYSESFEATTGGWQQVVYFNGAKRYSRPAGQLVLTGWVQLDGDIGVTASSPAGGAKVLIRVMFTDGTETVVSSPPMTGKFAYAPFILDTQDFAECDRMIASATVIMALDHAVGLAWFDDLRLTAYPNLPPPPPDPPMADTGAVVLMHDDGWKSHASVCAPILRARGLVGSYAIVPSYINDSSGRHMTIQDLQGLVASGDDLCNHSWSHAHMMTLSDNDASLEILQAENSLASWGLNAEPKVFIAPYGEFDNRIKQIAKSMGYASIRGTQRGSNERDTNPFNVRIQEVNMDVSSTQVDMWLDQAIATDTCLILLFHEVADSGDDVYRTTPAFYVQVADHIVSRGLRTLNYRQAMAEFLTGTDPDEPVDPDDPIDPDDPPDPDPDPINLIPNGNLETATDAGLPESWRKGGFGTNTRVLTYPVAGYLSDKALRTEITEYTSGDAKWYFNEITVSPGTTYRFSNYYLSSTQSYVTVQYRKTDNSFQYLDLLILPAASDWTQTEVTFTVPADVQTLTIFHLIKSVGSLTTDEFSLTAQ